MEVVVLSEMLLMIQWMLAIWYLVPLPFLNSASTSRSSQFTYCCSLTWWIFSITLLECKAMNGSLNIWKFTVHVLLKSGLGNFEHYFTSVWDECNCVVVWTFFGIAFFWGWITINCGKFWKRWEYQTTWHASWEICMQVRKQQLQLNMEQQAGSKSGKEYVKAVYCHPAYLAYMHHEKRWTGGSTSWHQDCQEKYQ